MDELVKAYWRRRQGELVTCIWEQHKNTGSDSKASDILCNPATEMQCIDSKKNDVADDLQRQECICHIILRRHLHTQKWMDQSIADVAERFQDICNIIYLNN